VTARSSVGAIEATWKPLVKVSAFGTDFAVLHWVNSDAPLDYDICTSEDSPVFVHLNASDPIIDSQSEAGLQMVFTLTAAPLHGALSVRSQHPLVMYPGSNSRPIIIRTVNGSLQTIDPFSSTLSVGDQFASADVIFSPAADFSGVDSFAYKVHVEQAGDVSVARTAVRTALVNLRVTPVQDPFTLTVFNAVLSMEPFQLIDIDSWETSETDQVSLTAQLDGRAHSRNAHISSNEPERLTLATTQNLFFSGETGLGKGYDDLTTYSLMDMSIYLLL